MTTRDGQERGELADHEHDGDDDGSNDTVTEEQTQRTAALESAADTEEDTCTDTGADGDEDEVTRLEALVQTMLLVVLERTGSVTTYLGLEDVGPRRR